jgi:hypothetical protein
MPGHIKPAWSIRARVALILPNGSGTNNRQPAQRKGVSSQHDAQKFLLLRR